MIIDSNIYWFPENIFTDHELLEKFIHMIPRQYNVVCKVEEQNGKKVITIEDPVGYAGVDYKQGEYEFDKIISDLDEAGIDKAVMKVPCCNEWFDVSMARYFNDGMADFAARSKGRLIALATVNPFSGEAMKEEIRHCREDLHMQGVQLCAHYGKLYLDDPAFAPLFEVLEKYHMTAYVHHTPVPVENTYLLGYNNLRRSYGRCVDQMVAVSRELMSGLFQKYPNVKLVHSMLGGGFFAYKDMLLQKRRTPANADTVKRFDDNGDELQNYYDHNLFFELSHAQPWGKDVLELAVKVLGSDHIIYGSSYPVRREWMTQGAECIRALNISDEDKENILHRNAERCYGI